MHNGKVSILVLLDYVLKWMIEVVKIQLEVEFQSLFYWIMY